MLLSEIMDQTIVDTYIVKGIRCFQDMRGQLDYKGGIEDLTELPMLRTECVNNSLGADGC